MVKTYGLAEGEYTALLAAQDGRCAICTRKPRNRRLAVDHSHYTGKVRALLCYTCNHFVLRYVEGDPIAAHNASVYIAGIAAEYGSLYEPRLSQALPMEATGCPVVPVQGEQWLDESSNTTTNSESSATTPTGRQSSSCASRARTPMRGLRIPTGSRNHPDVTVTRTKRNGRP